MKKQHIPDEAFAPLAAVVAGPGLALGVAWENGQAAQVDLADWVGEHPRLAVLKDRALFERAELSEARDCVHWGDEENGPVIDGLHLWFLWKEQQGLPLIPDAFRRWRARHGLTVAQAAKALGMGPRMVSYYESGQSYIPLTVALACRGWEALEGQRAA